MGQKWGDQNGPPYPLGTEQKSASEKRLAKQDKKWLKKQDKTTTKKFQKKAMSSKTMKAYDQKLRQHYTVRNKNGTINQNYINAYNQALAQLMNANVASLNAYSPSGMTLAFVAKRGEVGVYTAMTTPGYDMSQVKRGVRADGKIAYKKERVGLAEY